MENRIFFADSIEDGADGIGDSPKENPEHAGHCEDFYGLFKSKDDEPAHEDIKNHGELFIAVVVYCGEKRAESGKEPFCRKNKPCGFWIHRAHCNQKNWSIGSGDEKIDGAVVDDLHDLLSKAGLKAVINA